MRTLRVLAGAALTLSTVVLPQAALAFSDAAKRYAYDQCSYGQWEDEGYSSFRECTYYKAQEYDINHPS